MQNTFSSAARLSLIYIQRISSTRSILIVSGDGFQFITDKV